MSDEKIGTQLLDALSRWKVLEWDVGDELHRLCGIDVDSPAQVEIPIDDVKFDDYDSSFEFKGCKVGWEPTTEQLRQCLDLGFMRCWICYTDGSEIYFSGGELNFKKKSALA